MIVASGKSSRFGGFPKALAPIGRGTNVENTIRLARPFFNKIYLAVNKETCSQFERVARYCEVFDIQTGAGEAHSLVQISEAGESISDIVPVLVACANDPLPYAWFETNGLFIRKAHFASTDGPVDCGIHDQSLFQFNVDRSISYLEKYKKQLRLPDKYDPDGTEMKLLYSFEYLYNSEEFGPAQYAMIDSGNVLSFNTTEELETISRKIFRSRVEEQKGLC